MNVYDFDKTIYPRDSTVDFWLFCLRRHPAALLSLGRTLGPGLRFLTGGENRGELKSALYAFLGRLAEPEREVSAFWDENIHRIGPWYLVRRRPDDLVISASPDFLIGEACRRLGIAHLATDMDIATGRLRGPNCRGEEKIRRFRAAFGNAAVEEFYSDSMADKPMMLLAKRAFLVKNGAVLREMRFPAFAGTENGNAQPSGKEG